MKIRKKNFDGRHAIWILLITFEVIIFIDIRSFSTNSDEVKNFGRYTGPPIEFENNGDSTDQKLTIFPVHWLLLDQNRSSSSGDTEVAKAFCRAGRAGRAGPL